MEFSALVDKDVTTGSTSDIHERGRAEGEGDREEGVTKGETDASGKYHM